MVKCADKSAHQHGMISTAVVHCMNNTTCFNLIDVMNFAGYALSIKFQAADQHVDSLQFLFSAYNLQVLA